MDILRNLDLLSVGMAVAGIGVLGLMITLLIHYGGAGEITLKAAIRTS